MRSSRRGRTSPEAYRQRAEVLLALGGRNKEAGEALDRYLKLGGKPTPEVHRARGLLHARRREYRDGGGGVHATRCCCGATPKS